MICPKESDCHDPACAGGCKWAVRIDYAALGASIGNLAAFVKAIQQLEDRVAALERAGKS